MQCCSKTHWVARVTAVVAAPVARATAAKKPIMMAEVPVARARASLSVSARTEAGAIRVARRSDRRTLLAQLEEAKCHLFNHDTREEVALAQLEETRCEVFNHDTRDKAAKEEMAELRSGEEEAVRSEEEQICSLRQEEEQMRALSDENLAKKRAVACPR